MKKFIAILLIISFVLSLTSCGNQTDLNLDNYEDYLIITTTTAGGGETYKGNVRSISKDILGGTKTVYTNLLFNTAIKGASTNFNYKGVTVRIRVSGSYYYLFGSDVNNLSHRYNNSDIPKQFTLEYDIPLNISGDGNGETAITDLLYPNGHNDPYRDSTDLKYVTSDHLINVTYEVISISGYVEPA